MRRPLLIAAAAVVVAFGSGCGLLSTRTPKDAAREASPGATLRPATQADVDALLAAFQPALEATRRPVVHIALQALSPDDVHLSKVGGRPWWPMGVERPLDAQGKHLALLAQIDFSALPAPIPGYPTTGLAQFFIAANDSHGLTFGTDNAPDARAGYRVVYWPDTTGPAAADVPASSELMPFDPAKPRRMAFALRSETLTSGDFRFDALFPDGLYAAIEAFAAKNGVDPASLEDQLHDHARGGGHKLGGYPFFTQEDPRRDAKRELLLQLDSDDAMMWGDSGVANFFISPADLARADFHDVLYNWDCY
jgi:uncharacterized protein YwqG